MTVDAITYPLTIDALTPATIPLRRLADYLVAFASLLGSADDVRFEGVDEGSLVLRASAPRRAAAAIEPRLVAACAGTGAPDAVRAFRRLNTLLAEDDATARLPLSGGEVVAFPGRGGQREPLTLQEAATAQGRLTRIEGGGDLVGVGLEDETGTASRVFVTAALARSLASHFREWVRLSGTGRWRRDENGRWSLESLTASEFEVLDEAPLTDVLQRAGRHLSADEAAALVSSIRELRR